MKRLILSVLLLAFGLYCEKQKENQPPSITTVTSSSSTVEINQTITLKITASDPEGDQLSYKWGANGGSFPNGNSQATVSWQAPITPGTYKIWITVDDGNNHAVNSDLSIQVVKSQGTLIVSSTPEGAVIFINSSNTGRTTSASFQLDPGIYQIVLQKSGYNDWIGDAIIYANQTTIINAVLTVKPVLKILVVNSTPKGADIYLNGNSTGNQTNFSFTLREGTYSILLKKAGYKDYEAYDITLKADTTIFHANLIQIQSQKGILNINSNPTGADIYINGSPSGSQTNASFILNEGVYSIGLKKTGYQDSTIQNIIVQNNQTTTLNINLIPLGSPNGILEVNSNPTGAEIILDGLNTGKRTNYSFQLAPKLDPHGYDITLKKVGYKNYQNNNVEVKANQKTTINAILEVDAIQPSSGQITLIYPNGGEIFELGKVLPITWSTKNISGRIKIDIYEKSNLIENIESDWPNIGRYEWNVPDNFKTDNVPMPEMSYTIRLSSLDHPNIYDFTDDYFTIRRFINFSSKKWLVKNWYGGPGPNNFSDSPNNVYIDSQGRLHLKMNYTDKWYSAEVRSVESFGYGTYIFNVISTNANPIDKLDPNVIFGMFVYKDIGFHSEIDIEIASFSDRNGNLHYTVYPDTKDREHDKEFSLNYENGLAYSSHLFSWLKYYSFPI